MSSSQRRRSARFLTDVTRRIWLVATGLSVCCLCLAAFALGGPSQSGPMQLRLKFPPGNVHKYRNTLQVTATARQKNAAQAFTHVVVSKTVQQAKVTRTLPDGGGEITTTPISQEATIDGKPAPRPPSTNPTVVTYSALGKVLSLKRPAPPTVSALLTGENAIAALLEDSFLLPSQAVKPGDTWTQTIRTTLLPGVGTATGRYRFDRIEMVGGYRCARIHAVITMPYALMVDSQGHVTKSAAQARDDSAGTVRGTFDTDIALQEGKTVRSTGTGVLDLTLTARQGPAPGPKPPPPAHLTMRLTFTMETLP